VFSEVLMSSDLEKKKLIMEVARQEFAVFGYKRTTIDEIVRKAGVAKGTFYLYFKSKAELFKEVLKEIRSEIMVEYTAGLQQSTSPAEMLEYTLRFSLESLEKHPLFARVSVNDEEFRVALKMVDDVELRQEGDEFLKYFRGIFEQGIAQGELREDLDLDSVPLLFGSLKLLHYYREMIVNVGLPEERFIDALVDLGMNGIRKKGE
jgi:TetR/AcrR family transcriptional regulator